MEREVPSIRVQDTSPDDTREVAPAADQQTDPEKVKAFNSGPTFEKSSIVAFTITGAFLVALFVMVELTDNCIGDINNHGLRCLGPLEDPSDDQQHVINAYCNDVKNFSCHYLSARKEIHVHVQGQMKLCGNNFDQTRVARIQLWDADNFLHFGDDVVVRSCDVSTSQFTCHMRGAYLLEGSSANNPPDLYFKITIDYDTFCSHGREVATGDETTQCELNSRDHGLVIPHRDALSCRVIHGGSAFKVVTDPELTDQLLTSSSYFLETSQQDNWIVWKCFVEVNLDEIRPGFNCSTWD